MKITKVSIYFCCIFVLQLGVFSACTNDKKVNKSSSENSSNTSSTVAPTASTQKLLIFSKTEGYRHASIPKGIKAIESLAKQHNIATSQTEDAHVFLSDSLADFNAIIFLNTSGDILNDNQQKAFTSYIKSGGGFMGIHAATDTEFNWTWYGQMIGAYFDGHPKPQQATITVKDPDHPSTSFLSDQWTRTDEWYNFKDISPNINVLLNLEETSYEGGKNGDIHPIAWYQDFEGGRIFYTAGGHTKESYSEPMFLKHLWGGIEYVLE